jgi:glycerate kinase
MPAAVWLGLRRGPQRGSTERASRERRGPTVAPFLVAPDSFKGTFSAPAVAAAIGAGLAAGGHEADLCPVADGGEGTAAILAERIGGEWRQAEVPGPLGDPVEARFVLLGGGDAAALDMAEASGLTLVEPDRRDAEAASTRGTGELIMAAVEAGARRVLIGAGGSATTDGGAGAIDAINEAGGPRGVELVVLCDTATVFEDAARVFAAQKGADEDAVERLTGRLELLADGLPRSPRGLAFGGCAGGLSGGLWAAFGAELRSGAEFVLGLLDFDNRLAASAAVITGEGRVDGQSLGGKIVGEVARRARAAGRPLHLIVGGDDLDRASAAELGATSIEVATTLSEIELAGRRLANDAPD